MPKIYRKKNKAKKRKSPTKNTLAKRTRTLVPSIYHFTRSQVFDVDLATLNSVTPQGVFFNYNNQDGRNCVIAQYRFSIGQIPDYAHFSNLFKFYKLNAVQVKIYPSCGIGGGIGRDNSQMIIYTMPIQAPFDPQTSASVSEEAFLKSQICSKKLLLNNNTAVGHTWYQKLRIVMDSSANALSEQAMVRPKWIPFTLNSATEQDIPHYGLQQRWQSVNNGTNLPPIQAKVVCKYYFSMKQVR